MPKAQGKKFSHKKHHRARIILINVQIIIITMKYFLTILIIILTASIAAGQTARSGLRPSLTTPKQIVKQNRKQINRILNRYESRNSSIHNHTSHCHSSTSSFNTRTLSTSRSSGSILRSSARHSSQKVQKQQGSR